MTAPELLAKFTGGRANQYRAVFQPSDANRIVAVEVHAFGMANTTVRYSAREVEKHEVSNVLRIMTADGFEAVSGVDTFYDDGFSDEHAVELQGIASTLTGQISLDPLAVAESLGHMHPDLSDAVRSSIDIALWDLAAQRAGCPLYELLGAKRSRIESYASFPFYASLPEYVDAVRRRAGLGFRTFKFHVWGSLEEDLRLVELLKQTFAETDFRFMIDLEEKYNFEDALRLASQMDSERFVWLEGPMQDEYLELYAKLRSKVTTQIISDGCRCYSPDFVKQGIECGAWDAGRFDATKVGGVSKALELLSLADKAGLPMEIQSWGHALSQVVNLHLALACSSTRYFESPTPIGAFEFGMKNRVLLDRGFAAAPRGTGLGIAVDWDRLPGADFHVRSRFCSE